MKIKKLKNLLSICVMLLGFEHIYAVNPEKIRSTNLIQNTLRGYRVRKKSDKQFILAKSTVVKPLIKVESCGTEYHTYKLLDKESSVEYGRIEFCVFNEMQPWFDIVKVEEKHWRKGVGTYLINMMLRKIYEINEERMDDSKEPYTEVMFLVKPQGGGKLYSRERFDKLISFYTSLDAEVCETIDGCRAIMRFKL